MQKMYTPKDVAEMLSVSEYTIRKWIREGKIAKTMKFGHKTIRIPQSSMDDFLVLWQRDNEMASYDVEPK